ncbi:MAG: hypothetical protein JXR76_22470, partial [Deltaproteobacteria bacterium]|nr:hypothetical protein [Deltaproteobacteria bacterium]
MKNKIKVFISLLTLISTFCLSASAGDVKMCIEWPYEYEDMGLGEDYLLPNIGGVGETVIKNVTYFLKKGNSTSNFGEGRLDEDGCARFNNLKPGETYKMQIVADVKGTDKRGITILSSKSMFWKTGTIGNLPPAKPFAFSMDIWWNSSWQGLQTYYVQAPETPETRALIAANHLLLNANKLNWKKDRRIHIAVNNDKICAENVGPHHPYSAGEDLSVEKICLLEDKAGKTYDVRRKSTV